MRKNLLLCWVSSFIILFTACQEEEPEKSIVVPISYTFERAGKSTVSFDGQITRIAMASELVSAMMDFNKTEATLLEMYRNETETGQDVNPFSEEALNGSPKSIKSKIAASRDFFSSNSVESARVKNDFEIWIKAQVGEVFQNENVLAAPGAPGQIADGSSVRYINGKGLEYNQAVNKGMIGALMVDQMINNYLSPSVLDEGENRDNNDLGITEEGKPYTTMEHKWDEAYGYLFGASTNSASPLVSLGEDDFLNKYLERVDDDPDFAGIAQDIFNAFKVGRAAIVERDYNLRDEQAEIIKGLVSRVIAVRAVYYLQQGKIGLRTDGVNLGGAFHDLSEGFGFVYSLRFTRQPESNEPYFTREEVDQLLNQLTKDNGFWDLKQETLDQLSQDISERFDFRISEAAE